MKNLLLLLAATLAALLLAEGVVRLLPAERLGFVYTGEGFRGPSEFREVDPRELPRNRQGFHAEEPAAKTDGVRRVALLGDSYVAARSVEIPQTVGARLGAYLNAQEPGRWDVVAWGTPGWGLGRELEALRRYGPEARPDLVVTLFLPLNDPIDDSPALRLRRAGQLFELVTEGVLLPDLKTLRPRYLLVPGSRLNQLVSERLALRRRRAWVPPSHFVYAIPPDPEWTAAWETVGRLLAETRDAARSLGADYALAVASTPYGVLGAEAGRARMLELYPGMRGGHWDLDAPGRRMAAMCREREIPWLDLEPAFRDATARGAVLHWAHDGHWNVAGNDLAGRLLADWIAALPVDRR